jgi:hypothetical protein
MFGTDVREGQAMAVRVLGAAGAAATITLIVVGLLALGFEVHLSQAISKGLPLTLAVAVLVRIVSDEAH